MSTSFNQLNSVFENTTNSYKFYWWLSILKLLKTKGNEKIELEDIVFEMLVFVWYPINYYKISLGKQDQLTKYIKEIKLNFNISDKIDDVKLMFFLKENRNIPLIKSIIKNVLKYVPYRFIRPWYPETKGTKDHAVNEYIVCLQKDIRREPPYIIQDDYVLINDKLASNFKGTNLSNCCNFLRYSFLISSLSKSVFNNLTLKLLRLGFLILKVT